MKIKIQGFEWHLGNGISLDDYLSELKKISGIKRGNRLIATVQKDGVFAGVLITVKNAKAFCQIMEDRGNFEITPKELEEGAKIADFNFFIVDRITAKGLYQYYHNSASTNTFCKFCKDQYERLKQNKIDGAIKKVEDANGGKASKRDVSKIKESFKGSLRYSTLLKPDTFEEITSELNNFNFFQYEFSSIRPMQEAALTALQKNAERETCKVFFKKKSDSDSIKQSILAMLPNLKRATVKGVDPTGNELTYKLINDYHSFAEYDYDEIIKTVKIDSDNLSGSVIESQIIKILIALAQNDHYIGMLISESTA
jgi:hypothetical protein